jgi:hypothetical protein
MTAPALSTTSLLLLLLFLVPAIPYLSYLCSVETIPYYTITITVYTNKHIRVSSAVLNRSQESNQKPVYHMLTLSGRPVTVS